MNDEQLTKIFEHLDLKRRFGYNNINDVLKRYKEYKSIKDKFDINITCLQTAASLNLRNKEMRKNFMDLIFSMPRSIAVAILQTINLENKTLYHSIVAFAGYIKKTDEFSLLITKSAYSPIEKR